jgi:hypothetical protein
MAPATPVRVSDKEVQARAKMATFIDRVIDTIQSTPQENRESAEDGANTISPSERPAAG